MRMQRWALGFLVCLLKMGGTTALSQTSETEAFARAEVLFAERDWKGSVTALDAFIRQFPKSENVRVAYLRLGQAYTYLAEDAAARQAYAHVIELNPNDLYASQAVSLWGNLYVERYRYREAMQMCQEVMRRYPQTRAAEMAHYLWGVYAYSDRQTDEAIRAFSGFLDAFPNSLYRESALRQLVSILLYASRYDEAETILTERLDRSPQDIDLVEQLAAVYRKQERYEDALRLLATALERQPQNVTLLEALGETYAAKGDRTRALETWREMIKGGGSSYDVHQRLGLILKQNGFYDEAAQEYEAALRLQPTYSYLYTLLAEIRKIQGNTQAALNVYLDALERVGIQYGGREPVLDAIGDLYPPSKRAEGYANAVHQLRARYGETLETNPVALLTVAELSFAAGNVEESLAGFERLAALYADGGALLVGYAHRLAERGDAENAARFYETVLRLFPNAADTASRYLALGRQYLRLKRWDEAVKAFQRSAEADPQRRLVRDVDLLIAETMLRGQRRPEEAEAHLKATRNRPGVLSNRGRLLLAEIALVRGNYEEAAKQLEAFSAGDTEEEARAAFLRAESEFLQGNYGIAAEKYREVVSVAPSSSVATGALQRLALLRAGGSSEGLSAYVAALQEYARGNLTGARAALRTLIGAAPTAPLADYARMTLAEIALESQDVGSASSFLSEIAEGESSLAGEALLRLAEIRRQRGETQAAIQTYQRLLERFPYGAYSVEARENLKVLASTQP